MRTLIIFHGLERAGRAERDGTGRDEMAFLDKG